MDPGSPLEISELLIAWREGDRSALDRLVPAVEGELRRIAHAYLSRERSDSDLQTTAVINEVYIRLIDTERVNCEDRSHFYAICAQVMRRVLVDRARARKTVKRGCEAVHVSFDEACPVSQERLTDILIIDEALETLTRMDPRKGAVVEMRFFGGLSVEETAQALQISQESVMRDWRLAKLWLLRILSSAGENNGNGG
ncbi:MAG: sigma-70 family RNA polymerase sigma factor [Acidobacteria bacterium]|nr:sigma-70 family RNA polymerase sigma factor [Acidobacteriota bacterium]